MKGLGSGSELYLSNHCTFHSLQWRDENSKIIVMKWWICDENNRLFSIWNFSKKLFKKVKVCTFLWRKFYRLNIFKKIMNFWIKIVSKNKEIATNRLKLKMRWIVSFHCDEFSLQEFFSLQWIHCLLTSIVLTVPI